MSRLYTFLRFAKHCLLHKLFFYVFLPFIFICSFYDSSGAESKAEPLDEPQMVFENALFRYHTDQYLKAVIRFTTVITYFPDWERKNEAINYLVRSLSRLHFSEEVAAKIQEFQSTITGQTLLAVIEDALGWDDHDAALGYLRILSQRALVTGEKDQFYFLMSRTLVSIGDEKEAINNIDRVSDSGMVYFAANIVKARMLFQKRDVPGALELLEALQKKILLPQYVSFSGNEQEEIALLSGQIYFELGEYAKATSFFVSVKDGIFTEDALVGGSWSSFKSQDFELTAVLLTQLQKEYPSRFEQENLLPILAFSHFYRKNYLLAAESFDLLQTRTEDRKAFMENVLQDDGLCRTLSLVALDFIFGLPTKESTVASSEEKDFSRQLTIRPDVLLTLESGHFISLLESLARRSVNVLTDWHSLYKNRYDFVTKSVESLKRTNDGLERQYERIREKVVSATFQGDQRAVSNDNYMKEWLKDNISKYAGNMERELTPFEKNIIALHTQSILYSQKVDSKFIQEIVVNENSLETLHKKSVTAWRNRIQSLSGTDNEFISTMENLATLKNKLERVSDEMHDVREKIVSSIYKFIKKEAFITLLETSVLKSEIEEAYRASLQTIEKEKKVFRKRKDLSE